jgi:sigma-E factor negative regulatory protein RseC
MIEETGTVVSQDGDWAIVEPDKTSSCGSCSVRSGCGTASLSRFFGQRSHSFQAQNPINAKPGDRVVMGLDESLLIKGSVLVYLLPIAGMIAAAILMSAWAGLNGLNQELWSFIGLILGLLLGGFLARYWSRRGGNQLNPKIIRLESAR